MLKSKQLLALFAGLVLVSANAVAQSEIAASRILEDLKNGMDVSYENVTITGDLDLTYYFEKKYDDEYSKRRSWFDTGDNEVEEMIESKIRFVNCTFDDDVLAYYHDDRTEYTFTASFEQSVQFVKCTFSGRSAFKYSEFEEGADFSGSSFDEEALFKYAKFERSTSFKAATFDDDANFKYAKFRQGLDFSNTKFNYDLNLKYAKIRGDFGHNDMNVRRDLDVKYTEVNGDSFSKYLIKEE